MDKYKRLNFARGIFAFIIFVAFGIIIVTEKGGKYLIPKVKDKFNEYLQTNYVNIINYTSQEEPIYKDREFTMKIYDKTNKNHYFYIKYSNGEITDTYQEDYIEGKSLLENISKEIEKEIYNKTKIKTKVKVLSSLDKYTTKVQELILKNENLINSRIYSLDLTIDLKPWNELNASIVITNTLEKFKNKGINPKSYTITINNIDEITESIEISNINNEFIANEDKVEILKDILNNDNTKLVKENKITFKHLN